MSNQELFESILNNCTEKKIISYAKKLIKKCSFNSGECARNLCSLAYWLYVYGYEDDALKLAEITHDVEFPGKAWFNVWSFLLYVWGLEVYILKKKGEIEKAEERIRLMDKYMSYPELPDGSKRPDQLEIQRRNRFTYEYVSNTNEIETAYSKSLANEYRFTSLFQMIGYTYTGLFPNLLKDEEKISKLIDEYIAIIKN